MMCGDVRAHGIRNKIAHTVAGGDARAQPGGGKIKGWPFQDVEIGLWFDAWEAGALIDSDACHALDCCRLAPLVKNGPIIGADDEVKASVWGITGAQGAKRINCIGWCWSIGFAGFEHEIRIVGDGQLEHGDAVLRARGGDEIARLVWGDPGRDKQHTIQLQLDPSLLGDGKVRAMHRVERAAQHTELHVAESSGAAHARGAGGSVP